MRWGPPAVWTSIGPCPPSTMNRAFLIHNYNIMEDMVGVLLCILPLQQCCYKDLSRCTCIVLSIWQFAQWAGRSQSVMAAGLLAWAIYVQ